MRVRRTLAITLFLLFVAEDVAPYGEYWIAPFGWAHHVLMDGLPWKLRIFDHISALCLFFASRSADGKGPRVLPMRNAVLLAAVTTVVLFAFGVMTGGGAWQASWQTYLLLSGILLTFSLAAAFRTPQHWLLLGKVILAAAAYRAVMCWAFFFLYMQPLRIHPAPEFITSHDDSVLWVVAMLILLVHMIESRGFASKGKAFVFLLFLAGAVLFNQRRLAWVSLAMAMPFLLILLPPSKRKRRATRVAFALAPILAIYCAIGWGRTETIFKPLQSLATVSTTEDASTKARNVENLGLISTFNAANPLLGTGWGHPYVAVSNKYSIASIFPLWAYMPHNSMLGMLTYTGILGFFGYWLPFPTAMFLNARTARFATSPLARQIATIGAAQLVVCANQFYGDIGMVSAKTVYMFSFSFALALRLPIFAGVWHAPRTRSSGGPRSLAKAPPQRTVT